MRVIDALKHIEVNGKKSGYKINFDKTQYVMCKVTNKEELLRKLHILKEIGLKDEKIKVHPDSVSLLDNPTNAEIEEEKAERTVKYGGRLLGAYIGSNEFVRENLQKKFNTLNIEKQNLINHPNRKNRFLLTKFCFIAKLNYIFRTQTPNESEFLLPLFNDMQYEITLSLFTTNPNSIHPQKREFLRNITKLSGMQGGLGLRNQDAVHSSAYISSIVSCIYNLSKTFPEYIKTDGPQNSFIFIGFASHIKYLNELNTYNNERINNPDLIPPNPPTEDKLIKTLINATNHINSITPIGSIFYEEDLSNINTRINKLFNILKNLNINTVNDYNHFNDSQTKKSFNLQSHIYDIITENVKNQIIQEMEREINTNLSNYKNQKVQDLAFLTSIQNDVSHLWLNSNSQKYWERFSDKEFTTNLHYRYHLDIPYIPNNLVCDCCRVPPVKIDRKGSHFVGSCNREHMAGHRHNKVRDIFAQVLSDVGAQVITEPAQFLDQGLKPDIEAHVVPGYDSPITFDIRITQPATSLRKDPRNALNHLRANEKQKNDLYSHPMSENGFMFMPIIFESLGNTLPEVRSFMFKIYKNYYSDRGESNEESTMNAVRKVRFWLKKIVCAINKQNSTGILCRTQNLINKKNFSRQSNNKFRDRPHMIQAEFENGIEDENNFQIQEIDFQNGIDEDDA